ncbi:reverse transcriptase domain-containing protein [Trichonephila clavipes]|nr:reverse transcriptase domain-containing protein [Trichonephila clavipes]
MGNREFTRNSTSTTSSCKGHCVMRVYGIIDHKAILFRGDGCFWSRYRHCEEAAERAADNSSILELLELSAAIFLQPGSPHLNQCDFWLKGYLKNVFITLIVPLAELKLHIVQHILNVTRKTLRSVVEHAVFRFKLVAENGGWHTEHVLLQFREI